MNAPVPSSISSAFRTAWIRQPPHDPMSLLLNGRLDWRAGVLAGLVVGPGADLYVCDTGLADVRTGDPCADVVASRARLRAENHRVSVFALKGFALRGHLRPPRSDYPYWEPFAVACDSRRRTFVTDFVNDV